jgi:sigma-B regulation protein RsbU (phosphoserine phosphatase)
MPGSDPQVPGLDVSGTCLPASEVGGDFFDFFWIDPGRSRFGILIGDVSGKAMKAAMTAVMANGMIVSEALKAAGTGAVLSHVNMPLFQKTNSQVFVAACLAAIDTGTRELVLTNAGLTSPQLRSCGRVEAIDVPGCRFPLGMVAAVGYEQRTLRLQAGDLLLFVTDGVTEAHNRDREYYGEERLRALLAGLDGGRLSARQVRDAVVADVKRFAGRQPQFDDMTVVAVKVLPPPPGPAPCPQPERS